MVAEGGWVEELSAQSLAEHFPAGVEGEERGFGCRRWGRCGGVSLAVPRCPPATPETPPL